MSARPLTIDRALLAFFQLTIANGRPPTAREFCAKTEHRSTNAGHYWFRELTAAGFVAAPEGGTLSHGYKLTPQGLGRAAGLAPSTFPLGYSWGEWGANVLDAQDQIIATIEPRPDAARLAGLIAAAVNGITTCLDE